MHEDLRLQQRFVDQELEGHRDECPLLGRQLEPEMFAEEPLGHEVELALEWRAIVGGQRRCRTQSPHLDVRERGERLAVEFVDATSAS